MVMKLILDALGMFKTYFVGLTCEANCMGLPEHTAPNISRSISV